MIFTKNKEGVRAIRAMKYKKYVAGKYTRARAPLARKCTNRIFESKNWHNKYENGELDWKTNFVSMICLPSPIVLKYRLTKQRNELLGHPVKDTENLFQRGFFKYHLNRIFNLRDIFKSHSPRSDILPFGLIQHSCEQLYNYFSRFKEYGVTDRLLYLSDSRFIWVGKLERGPRMFVTKR